MSISKLKRVFAVFLAVLIFSLAGLFALDLSAGGSGKKIQVDGSPATYYTGDQGLGVILSSGRTANRTALLNLLRGFGAHILVVDYAPEHIDGADPHMDALTKELAELSGLSEDKLIAVSADATANAALERGLHANPPLLGCVLFSPIVDVTAMVQEGGYSCALSQTEHLLIAGMAGSNDPTDVALAELFNYLSGDMISSNGSPFRADKGIVSLQVVSGTILSDSPSQQLIDTVGDYIEVLTGLSHAPLPFMSLKNLLWLLSSAALIGCLLLSVILTGRIFYSGSYGIKCADVKSRLLFLSTRLLVWFAALPLTGAFLLLFTLFHAPIQFMGRLFVSYAIGCAVTTGLLYRFHLVPGITGSPTDVKVSVRPLRFLLSVAVTLAVAAAGALLSLSGFWRSELGLSRLIYLAVLWALTFGGLLGLSSDSMAIELTNAGEYASVVLLLTPYLPLLALPVLNLLMGQLAVSVALLKCFGALVCTVLLGKAMKNLTGSALVSSFLASAPFALFFAAIAAV